MTDHANELRRYARKIAHPAGDVPSVMLAAAEEIERLAARLEATESDALEQARLNGMGSEREAALMAKLEAAEKSDAESLEMYRRARDERDALRAKIERMEQQEPVAWARKLGLDVPSFGCVTDLKYRPSNIPESSYIPLYTLPGAQPAPSVPDGFSREDLEAVADGLDGYEKTVNVGNVTGEGDDHLESTTAYAARFIRTMLAAAPEVKQ